MHLVPKPSRAEPRTWPPVYSDAVRSALSAIKSVHAIEEAKLDAADRLDLAAALELLIIARLLEAQICVTASSS